VPLQPTGARKTLLPPAAWTWNRPSGVCDSANTGAALEPQAAGGASSVSGQGLPMLLRKNDAEGVLPNSCHLCWLAPLDAASKATWGTPHAWDAASMLAQPPDVRLADWMV
jgi:hypothetical protein